MNNQHKPQQNESILQEIFLSPSDVLIEDRFISSTEAADCSGKCGSGVCRAVV